MGAVRGAVSSLLQKSAGGCIDSSAARLVIVALIFCLVLSFFIDASPVGSSSEAREGMVVQSILRNHAPALPLRNGVVPSKPPVYHWMGALVSYLRGRVDEFSIRLPSLLAAAGLIILTGLMGIIFTGGRTAGKRECRIADLLPPLILIFTYGFGCMAGAARVDMVFSFFTVCALVGILGDLTGYSHGCSREPISGGSTALFCAASALAVLSKGPLGFVLPFLICYAWTVRVFGWTRAACCIFKPRPQWMLLPVICGIYYFAVWCSVSAGKWDEFIFRQFYFENAARFTGEAGINVKPVWFYIPVFIRTAFPWSILFAAFLALDIRAALLEPAEKVVGTRKKLTPASAGGIWFLTGFILFSSSSGKRGSYLLPLFPGMALYVAARLERMLAVWSGKEIMKLKRMGKLLSEISLLLLCVMLGSLEVLPDLLSLGTAVQFKAGEWMTVWGFQLEAVVLCAAGLFWLISELWCFSCGESAALQGVFYLFLLLYLSINVGLGLKNSFKQFPEAAAEINRLVPKDRTLYLIKDSYDEYFDPLLFYLGREVEIKPAPIKAQEAGSAIVTRQLYFSGCSFAKHKHCRSVGRFRSVTDYAVPHSGRELVLLFSG